MIQGYSVLRRLFLIQWLFCSMTYLVCDTTLAFCSLQKYLIRDVRAIFSIPYSSQSPDIGQNSDRGISEFRISGQSLIKINCHNSWTSDDIDIKLGLVTKLDKRKKNVKKFDDDVMSKNCDVVTIFPIYGQFGTIWRLDFGRIVCKTYIFIKSNFLSYRNLKQN